MSGENETYPSGMSVDNAMMFINRRFLDLETLLGERKETQETAMNTALAAAKEAVQVANIAAEKRFDSVNEFRSQLSDQAGTFTTRTEIEIKMTGISEKITDLSDRIKGIEERSAGKQDQIKLLIALAGLALLVVSTLIGLAVIFK